MLIKFKCVHECMQSTMIVYVNTIFFHKIVSLEFLHTCLLSLNIFRKLLNSHLFGLNSHPFFASWSRNAANLQALRTRQARPGCEFNQKRCEFKNFLYLCVNQSIKNDFDSLYEYIFFLDNVS
jgi:hypothetical protein